MNALDLAGQVITIGGAQLGRAVLTVLGWTALFVAALFAAAGLGLAAWIATAGAAAWWYTRQVPYVTVDDDELGEDVVRWWGRGIPGDVRDAITERESRG